MKPERFLLLLLVWAAGARAGENWSFSGFGTLGAAWSSSRDGDYVLSQAKGPGRTHAIAENLDSLIAGQLDWRVSPGLAASVQAVSQDKPERSWAPFIRLANLRFAVNDQVQLRVGLLPHIQMLASEYRWVNYGNPFPRQPAEIYRILGSSDIRRAGADLNGTLAFPAGRLRWQLAAVDDRAHMARSNTGGVDSLRSRALLAALDWEREGWKFRVSLTPWGWYRFMPEASQAILDRLSQLDPENARYYDSTGKFRSLGLSVSYDSNRWIFLGEALARRQRSSWNREPNSVYATLGRHFGRYLPYATLARSYTGIPDDHPEPKLATAALLDGLYHMQNQSQSSLAFGCAYDLAPGWQLKTQFDLIRPDSGSSGYLTNLSPGYDRSHPPTIRLFSVSADFVF